ncbi:MAG: LysR family transcriptional regulator [Coriobacteriales bacterium]|nr:LysR family transcriptional regulator [Coriobacteriales bacterium]
MELRTLEYFLAVVREGNISGAAQALHMTQPTLSRQLSALESELGCMLYQRSNKGIVLTEHGITLARYAESIVQLAEKANEEIRLPEHSVAGPVHIAAGETRIMRSLARAMQSVRDRYPKVTFELYSGTSAELMDNLAKGFYDMLLECEVRSHKYFEVLELPERDVWGMLVRKDSHLAKLPVIHAQDLIGEQVIMSRQAYRVGALDEWLGDVREQLKIVSFYNLPLNSKFLVQEGVGSSFTYEGLFDGNAENNLVFIPLAPRLTSNQGILWRKGPLSRQAQVFLDTVRKECGQQIRPSDTF